MGLATLSQSNKGLATLIQAGAHSHTLSRQSQPSAALMQGFAGQPLAVARQQAAAVGLASLSHSGKGLAGLVQAGARAQGFSTLHLGAVATSGTTPGALHLGEITVSACTPNLLWHFGLLGMSVLLFSCPGMTPLASKYLQLGTST